MPPATGLDTSVLVAALLTWHENHETARPTVDDAVASGAAVLPVHALLETYAVLTRLPPPHRLSPGDAEELLSSSLEAQTKISGLAREVWPMLGLAASEGISGGSIYDTAIVTEAAAAQASSILTYNVADFERVVSGRLHVVEPSQTRID